MRKFIKFVIVLGVLLVLVGGAIVGYAAYKGKFGSVKYEQKEYVTEEDFSNLKINLETINVEFVKAEDSKCTIKYEAEDGYEHTFDVKSNTLEIIETCKLKWYERMFHWDFGNPKMSIALPKAIYDEVSLTVATGDIDIEEFSFAKMELKASTGDINLSKVLVASTLNISVSTGDVTLDYVTADACAIKSSTGSINLSNTVFSDALSIKASTGDVRFTKSDAKTIDVKTSTGDIKGDILTPKSFDAKASTGEVYVPSTTGEACTLRTSTGDIRITISE